ncbi:metallophosphoesterase 1 homolog [Contarinia nasturtii]|uniref:metallophosphoesterase 1 homolog n=1 Tax=Contarinia nasturtii TaxID=265458 RepID=UPI0012D470E5|nr:metallophosphoesterase 1 homolog [Contarinia nasturtii]
MYRTVFIMFIIVGATFLYNELLLNFVVLNQCQWPNKLNDSVRAIILADTHLLGPFNGHWFDKLRREWQMRRAFHAAVFLHKPDVVFILGDIFDEGQWVDGENFEAYLMRFHSIFNAPENVKVYSTVGNHDIGFHYRLHPYIVDRFKNAFEESQNSLITIKNSHFILLNSMTLSRDGCYFCADAEAEILKISQRLNCAKLPSRSTNCKNLNNKLPFYARPIVLQHFPTFRVSDNVCKEHDSPKIEIYRESWEVLSKEATKFLEILNPAVAFSGHTHNFCRSLNIWGVEEFTIASFSWRNKNNPSFLLAEFFKSDYAVSKCDMPREDTVVCIYITTGSIVLLTIIYIVFSSLCSKITTKKSKKI